jgi:pimeloyl-ACP methyl ester carboxylesterase
MEGDKSGHEDGTTATPWRPTTRQLLVIVLLGVVLAGTGVAVGTWVSTDGGDVSIETTSFETESGLDLTATVYRPAETTANDSRPAVLLIHGAGADRGTMSSFGQEFAERGYVAVAVDQPGHRDSDPPAGADGFGGPASLAYTRSLDTVDEDRVSLVGHSLGGFASLTAAEDDPDGYQSVVLLSSTWGDESAIDDVPVANESFPRNMAVVFGKYDEFGPLMWDEDVPGNLAKSDKLAAAFPTEPPVQRGKLYGSVEDGTARTLTQPPTIHGGMHRSTTAVADTIEWVTRTNEPPEGGPDPSSQDWYWATVGHVLALLGALVVCVSVTAVAWRLLETDPGDGGRPTAGEGDRGRTAASGGHGESRRTLVGIAALPALTFLPLLFVGQFLVPTTRVTHQADSNAHALWALGAVAVGAGVARWRSGSVTAEQVRGLFPGWSATRRAVGATGVGLAAMALVVLAGSTVPGVEFRAWVLGLGVLPPIRGVSIAVYVGPLTVSTVALSYTIDRVLGTRRLGRRAVHALAVTCGGMALLIAIQYLPLFLGLGMPIPMLGPLAFAMFRATVYLAIATVVCVFLTRVSEQPLLGGLLAGVLATAFVAGPAAIDVAPI